MESIKVNPIVEKIPKPEWNQEPCVTGTVNLNQNISSCHSLFSTTVKDQPKNIYQQLKNLESRNSGTNFGVNVGEFDRCSQSISHETGSHGDGKQCLTFSTESNSNLVPNEERTNITSNTTTISKTTLSGIKPQLSSHSRKRQQRINKTTEKNPRKRRNQSYSNKVSTGQGNLDVNENNDAMSYYNNKCVECENKDAPYKCPKCRRRYCRVDCYKQHLLNPKCVRTTNNSADSSSGNVENAHLGSKGRKEYEFPTEDTLKLEGLQTLRTDPELRKELQRLLQNDQLRQKIRMLDSCRDPCKEFERLNADEDFAEFRNFIVQNMSRHLYKPI